jgi:hypothetical protein
MKCLKCSKLIERFLDEFDVYVVMANPVKCDKTINEYCRYCCNIEHNIKCSKIYVDYESILYHEGKYPFYFECRCFNLFNIIY